MLSLLLAGACAAIEPAPAHAQTLIKRPVRILVPVPAGGNSDTVARLVAEIVRDAVGQPVVVENRPGASGRIAGEMLKHAAPDGATLLVTPIALPVIGPLVFKDLPYDPAQDFAPVSQVAKFPFAFAVGPGNPAGTLPGYVAWARDNPGAASFGTGAAGSLPHFLGMMVGRATGIAMVHVQYKGATSLTTELMSGEVSAGIGALSDLIELHRAGRIRIIATSGAERSPLVPTVPTFREQGFPAIEVTSWNGMFAPAKTPQPVIDRLSTALVDALRTVAVREKFVSLGLEPTGTTPEEFAAIMRADTARWAAIFKASGFTADRE